MPAPPHTRRRLGLLASGVLLSRPVLAQQRAPGSGGLGEAIGDLGDALLRSSGAAAVQLPVQLVSPYSLHATLGLLALGEHGRNPSGLIARLGLGHYGPGRAAEVLARGRAAVLAANGPGVRIALGHAGWASRGRAFRATWRGLAAQAADATLGLLDFAGPHAAPRINGWASRATGGEIPRIVERLPADAELVLAGVIHFAGEWRSAFAPERTEHASFGRLDGGTVLVPMMRAETQAAYGADGLGHALRLDYRGGGVALWLGAAKRAEDSAAFLAGVAATGPTRWLRRVPLALRRVAVRLPKLAFGAGGEMLPALRAAGFGRALVSDFGGILGRPVRPSEILHQARIRVDERGTAAAAASAVVGTRGLSAPEEFSVDRPFIFVIGLTRPWMPLFLGYIIDASQAQD